MHVTFYTKRGCLLCDETEQLLKLVQQDYPIMWTSVYIEEDEASHEKYMFEIPVIEKDGEVLLSGKIDYIDILEMVNADV